MGIKLTILQSRPGCTAGTPALKDARASPANIPELLLDWPSMPSLSSRNRVLIGAVATVFVATVFVAIGPAWSLEAEPHGRQFFEKYCYDCHEGDGAEAGLDLASLRLDTLGDHQEQRLVTILDRVRDGEMPPADMDRPDQSDVDAFLKVTGQSLRDRQLARYAEHGRVRGRRLTRRGRP